MCAVCAALHILQQQSHSSKMVPFEYEMVLWHRKCDAVLLNAHLTFESSATHKLMENEYPINGPGSVSPPSREEIQKCEIATTHDIPRSQHTHTFARTTQCERKNLFVFQKIDFSRRIRVDRNCTRANTPIQRYSANSVLFSMFFSLLCSLLSTQL